MSRDLGRRKPNQALIGYSDDKIYVDYCCIRQFSITYNITCHNVVRIFGFVGIPVHCTLVFDQSLYILNA